MPATAATEIATFEALETKRLPEERAWKEIHDLLDPEGEPLNPNEEPGTDGETVLDNTGGLASELLASALYGINNNPSQVWFKVGVGSPNKMAREENARWLGTVSRTMLQVFNNPKLNFAGAQHEKYLDLVNYGGGAKFIAENRLRGPVFTARPVGEMFVAEGEDGLIATAYRRFRLTAKVAEQMFKHEAGPKVLKAAQSPSSEQDEFTFIHGLTVRKDRDPRRRGNRHMPIASVYTNLDEKKLARESGFPEMPLIYARLRRNAGKAYGRGRGHIALADVKTLQKSMDLTMLGVETSVYPPMQAADDGVLSDPTLASGEMTWVRDDLMQFPGGGIRPIHTGARPDFGENFMEGIRQRIDNAFFKYLLQMFGDPRMTATQVVQITEEVLRVLGPYIGRLQTEDLGPTIERVFWILFRAEAFPPMPDDLATEEMEITYTSPLALAQRLNEARAIANTLDMVAPLAQIAPEVMDNVDPDKTFRTIASIFGWPMDTIRDAGRVAEIRTARAEAQAQEVAKEDALAATGGLANLAKLMGPGAGGDQEAAA